MIVSMTDSVPGKKIVKTIDSIEATSNPFTLTSSASEKEARTKLERKAEELGANAIMGFGTRQEQAGCLAIFGFGHVKAYGTAVVVEDEK